MWADELKYLRLMPAALSRPPDAVLAAARDIGRDDGRDDAWEPATIGEAIFEILVQGTPAR